MGFKKKYKIGDRIGPYNILIIDEAKPKRYNSDKNRSVRQCVFECPWCEEHKSFISPIGPVRDGKTKSCGCLHKKQASALATLNCKKNLSVKPGDKFGKLCVLEVKPQKESGKHALCLCQCDCGFSPKWILSNSLISGTTQSCGCTTSRGEEKIAQILSSLNINFITKYQFKDCINPKTNAKLRFDFYLPDYNCCIEYDGEQHFIDKSVSSKWESLADIQYRDKIKDEYCNLKNIKIIRIPYFDFNQINSCFLRDKIGI